MQVSEGIRKWTINCCTSRIMIINITPTVDYNHWKSLELISMYPKFLSQQTIKGVYKTLSTSVIYSLVYPP